MLKNNDVYRKMRKTAFGDNKRQPGYSYEYDEAVAVAAARELLKPKQESDVSDSNNG